MQIAYDDGSGPVYVNLVEKDDIINAGDVVSELRVAGMWNSTKIKEKIMDALALSGVTSVNPYDLEVQIDRSGPGMLNISSSNSTILASGFSFASTDGVTNNPIGAVADAIWGEVGFADSQALPFSAFTSIDYSSAPIMGSPTDSFTIPPKEYLNMVYKTSGTVGNMEGISVNSINVANGTDLKPIDSSTTFDKHSVGNIVGISGLVANGEQTKLNSSANDSLYTNSLEHDKTVTFAMYNDQNESFTSSEMFLKYDDTKGYYIEKDTTISFLRQGAINTDIGLSLKLSDQDIFLAGNTTQEVQSAINDLMSDASKALQSAGISVGITAPFVQSDDYGFRQHV